jgi:putative MATE family efflux protein
MQDFTEGRIARQVISFSMPIMFGNFLLSIYGIINLIWVGRLLGHTAVAAVSAAMPIIMLMPAFLIGLAMAANVLISQAFGRKDVALLRKILSNAFMASLLSCLIISLIGLLFRHTLMAWVHTPPEIYDMTASYLTIIIATMVLQFFLNWMNAMLRGLGDAKTVAKILVLLVITNATFVPLFISGMGPLPSFGVAGAAIGTATAALTTGLIGYLYMMRRNPYINMKSWDFSVDWHIIRQVFIIGIPASLQMLVVSLAGLLIVSLVNRYGADVTAAFGIGMQIDMLAAIPSMSIGMAATSIAGQNLGAGKMDRVNQALYISLLFGAAFALLYTAVLAIFPYEIGAVFIRQAAGHTQVLDALRDYYRWNAFIFPCLAIIFVIQGVLRSAGDTVALLALSFIALIIIRIPLAYVLAVSLGYRQNGIWMAMLASSALAAGMNWLYLKHGRWRRMQIFKMQSADGKRQDKGNA